MRFFLIFLGLFSVLNGANAKDTKPTETPINFQMKKISGELEKLVPSLIDEEKFSAKENEKPIQEILDNLVKLFQGLKKHPVIQTPGFKISRNQIETQLEETHAVFRTNKELARHKINSTLGLCISCHTQLPRGDRLKLFSGYNLDNNFTGPFEKAEFYFITRDFEKAIVNYDFYINSFNKNFGDTKKLETSLNRKLTYFMRINRESKVGIQDFEQNLQNKELPNSVKERVQEWVKQLSKNSPSDQLDMKSISEQSMKERLDKITHDNERAPGISLFSYIEAQDLKNSGFLYQYLYLHPQSPLLPEILYNLALFDKRLNLNLFYSLGDLYLLECMEKYPKNPIAKKCYQAYEEDKIFSYTGSSGTSLPDDVNKELLRLKKKVGIKP